MGDDLDALAEIVDALAHHVEIITKERVGLFAPDEITRIESIAARARVLYQKRMGEAGELNQ
jgi:hypothetical protein